MYLRRSKTNRMIAGVCGGLGDEFNVDPAIIRLCFIFTTLVWGIGLIPYIVLWIVMPEAE